MVTRLLLSLRKASHPETIAQWNVDHFTGFYVTTATVTTRNPPTLLDTGVVDSVLELSDFES